MLLSKFKTVQQRSKMCIARRCHVKWHCVHDHMAGLLLVCDVPVVLCIVFLCCICFHRLLSNMHYNDWKVDTDCVIYCQMKKWYFHLSDSQWWNTVLVRVKAHVQVKAHPHLLKISVFSFYNLMFWLMPTPTFTHYPIKGPWVLTWTNTVYTGSHVMGKHIL